MEEYHLNFKMLLLCLWIIPSYHLLDGNVCKVEAVESLVRLSGIPEPASRKTAITTKVVVLRGETLLIYGLGWVRL